MKPHQNDNALTRSCSCSSCMYKSESDRASFKKKIARGSRIDKLYYGKYIPLRERKLLDKLIKTRAVYDDIKDQLLSGSSTSINKQFEKIPEKRRVHVEETDDTERSSAILEIVDLVDKGAVLKQEKLHECCSCCSCSSVVHAQRKRYAHKHEHIDKSLKSNRFSKHKVVDYPNVPRTVRFKTKHIRSDPCTCTIKFSDLTKKISKKQEKVESTIEPLAEIKPHALNVLKKSFDKIKRSKTDMMQNVQVKARKSLNKVKQSKERIKDNLDASIKRSLENIKTVGSKFKQKVNMKSIQKQKRLKSSKEIKNVDTLSIRKDSIEMFRETLRKKRILKDYECEPECLPEHCLPKECLEKLKRRKHEAKLKNAEKITHWVEPERLIKDASSTTLHKRDKKIISSQRPCGCDDITIKIPKHRSRFVKSLTSSPVLSKISQRVASTTTVHKSQNKLHNNNLQNKEIKKPVVLSPRSLSLISVPKTVQQYPVKRDTIERGIRESTNKNQVNRQVVRIGSSFSFNIEFSKEKSLKNLNLRHSKTKSRSNIYRENNKRRVIARDSGQETKTIHHHHRKTEARQNKFIKVSQTNEHALRRCFCTLKLKPKSKVKSTAKGIATSSQTKGTRTKVDISKEKLVSRKKQYKLLPYECEPGICIADVCDPYECEKILKKRYRKSKRQQSTTESRRTKSTSSVSSKAIIPNKSKSSMRKHYIKNQIDNIKKVPKIQSSIPSSPNRQAVRIGSNFSFNIEFFKNYSPYTTNNIPTRSLYQTVSKVKKAVVPSKAKQLKDSGSQGDIKNYNKSSLMRANNTDRGTMLIRPAMKRCFCTLKLQKIGKMKRKPVERMTTVGTKISKYREIRPSSTMTASKSTKTKSLKQLKTNFGYLEPYECEPYICVPKECDPHECLQRINRRGFTDNTQELGTMTPRTKMRSASSCSRVRNAKVRTKSQQKNINHNKISRNFLPSDYSKDTSIVPSRQAVRIGSSFNFSVEFYKNKPYGIGNGNSFQNSFKKISNDINPSKQTKDMGASPRTPSFSNRESQVLKTQNAHKASLVRPLLKRCFCTLRLQRPGVQQREKNRFSKMIPRKSNVYTVSRMTVVNNKELRRKLLLPYRGMSSVDIKSSLYLSLDSSELQRYLRYKQPPISSLQFESWNKSRYSMPSRQHIDAQKSILINNFTYSEPYVEKSKDVTMYKKFMKRRYEKELLRQISFYKELNINTKTNLTVNPFLKRCFCTMNIQLPTAQELNIATTRHKLKPYECEPGVCVPDECDPIECQKLIMKRLMRRASKMSNTESSRTRSMPSYALESKQKSRAKRLQSNIRKSRPSPIERRVPSIIKYEKIPDTSHKQAVRVGSSFSFSLEFSKDRHALPPILKPQYDGDKKSVHLSSMKDKATKGPVKHYNRDSQSIGTKMRHKASNISPTMKRCFCTLKLQKMGKQQRISNSKSHRRTMDNLSSKISTNTIQILSTGQNTNNAKNPKYLYSLAPYECEPQKCIPGECNPYECLELIKRRNKYHTKEFGTNSNIGRQRSISSATNGYKNDSKVKQIQSISRGRGSLKREDNTETHNIQKRQVVRIGSSFSFDVEFFKEKPPVDELVDSRSLQKKYTRSSKEDSSSTYKNQKTTLRQKATSDNQTNYHRSSQVQDLRGYRESTTTTNSFLKRCFCTKQLKPENKKSSKDINKSPKDINTSPSFVKRCLCLIKSLTKVRKTLNKERKSISGTSDKAPTIDKSVGKNRVNRNFLSDLKSYECEPGICVPDFCDPYKCEEIIKKRIMKQGSKASSTEKLRTKSISSSFKSSSPLYTRKIQSNITPSEKKSRPSKQSNFREKLDQKPSEDGNKQVVRIGSNFSFNVEFYKDQSPSTNYVDPMSTCSQRIKSFKPEETRRKASSIKNRGSNNRKISTSSSKTQTTQIRKEHRSSGVSKVLQRCFCTLKLNKKGLNEMREKYPRSSNKNIEPVILRSSELQDKSVMTVGKAKHLRVLEPYECEPLICVPGECNPYECKKLIKKRLNREYGTSLMHQKTKSVYSANKSTSGPKTKKVQHTSKQCQFSNMSESKKCKRQKSENTSPSSPSRQAVRIGSSFSFNIEFFKDNSLEYKETIKKRRISDNDDYVTPKRTLKSTVKRTHNIASQDGRNTKERKSQFESNLKHTSSTMTNVPFLKRCFCTLALKKPNKILKKSTLCNEPNEKFQRLDITTKDTGTITKKSIIRNLKPYECEPGVCIPNECNPYECEKRIRKRQMKSIMLGTERPRERSTCSYASVLKRCKNKKCQMQDYCNKQKRKSKAESKYSWDEKRVKINNNPLRQAVRIGSQISLGIEFYKEQGSPKLYLRNNKNISNIPNTRQCTSKPAKTLMKSKQLISRPSNGQDISFRHRKSQYMNSKKKSRASGMGLLLKRCFCTLKLQKPSSIPKPSLKTQNTQVKLSKPPIQYNRIYNEEKRISQILEPYECEPGTCVPGECKPYECAERIRKRGIRRKSRKSNTHRRFSRSTYIMTSECLSKSRRTQSNSIPKCNQSKCVPDRKTCIIEEPRFRNIMNNNIVKYGSTVNFNIELFKETVQPGFKDLGYSYSDAKNLKSYKNVRNEQYKRQPNKKNKSICMKANNLNTESQAGNVKAENKGTAVKNALKRCFCTLQLDKSTAPNTVPPKVINVRRVAVEDIRSTQNKAFQYYVQYQIEQSGSPFSALNFETKSKITERVRNCNVKSYSNEMETILPYKPRRFNKNKSKILLQNNDMTMFSNKKSDYSKFLYTKHKLSNNKYKCHQVLPILKIVEKNRFETNRQKYIDNRNQLAAAPLSDSFTMKNIWCRCKQIISHKNNFNGSKITSDNKKIPDIGRNNHTESYPLKPKKMKRINERNSTQKEVLKISKSDRYPVQFKTNSNPKTSKSLKITKILEEQYKHPKKIQHDIEQKSNKHLHFQSGDNNKNGAIPKKCNIEDISKRMDVCNKHICHYCQIKYNDNKGFKRTENSTYADEKFVQFLSIPSKRGTFKDNKICNKTTNTIFPCQKTSLENVTSARTSFFSQKRFFGCKTKNADGNSNKTYNNGIGIDSCYQTCRCTKDNKFDFKYQKNREKSNNKKNTQSVIQTNKMLTKNICENKSCFRNMMDKFNKKSYDVRSEITNEYKESSQPLLEIQMDSNSLCVLNKGEIINKMTKMKRKRETQKNKLKPILRNNNMPCFVSKPQVEQETMKCDDACVQPLFEMKIDSHNLCIFDEKEKTNKIKLIGKKVTDNVHTKKTKHGKFHRCFACVKRKKSRIMKTETNKIQPKPKGVKLTLNAKGQLPGQPSMPPQSEIKVSGKTQKIDNISPEQTSSVSIKGKKQKKKRKKSRKKQPCVCGSIVCAEESKKLLPEKMKKSRKKKPCVCGAAVCARETKKVDSLPHSPSGHTCVCGIICECKPDTKTEGKKADKMKADKKKAEQSRKNKSKKDRSAKKKNELHAKKHKHKKLSEKKRKQKEKMERKELIKRQKVYRKEDALRMKQRKRDDKYMDKKIKKLKKAGDGALVAESVLDIARLGGSTVTGLLRSSFRAVTDPKNTIETVRVAVHDPGRCMVKAKRVCADSGVASTARRIKKRLFMTTWAKKLDDYALTHYIMHIGDKDPKKRFIRKKKKKRKKRMPDPVAVVCSLFVATLRKRPCLAVYWTCPWFYPHCLSMLSLLKQFTNIMLFLLAIVVWSPCILCMEMCRAMMCCFLCTG